MALVLKVIDIDAPDTPKDLRARYGLEVPVLALDGCELHGSRGSRVRDC